jgi:hypothetical protein
MNRIYSDFELALSNIEKYMLLKEEDIYLCHSHYPSGVEYSYRTRKDISFEDSPVILKIFSLPIWHLFKLKGNAQREKKKFEQLHKCKLRLQRNKISTGEYVYTLKYVQ